ncbi:MAG: PKD domain-containing protein, partial [Clostridia bacterium]|nr:PKD domain-containing protein [Clostridia bacterium]
STMPWFTIAKNMQSAAVLETKIVNNSLIDVIDAVAVIEGNVSGISVVGGGYLGTIPAMSNVTVQLLVQPGYYDLPSFNTGEGGANKVSLRVTGSYVSFDEDTGLPVYPAKTTDVRVPIYNPGKQKINMEVVTASGKREALEIQMPDDSEVEELDYFIYQNETGERIKKDESASGGVYEIVKLSLSQTASLERQAFDAELKITNNYPNYNLESLTTEVVVQYTDPVTKEVSFITDNVYIIQTQGASVSSISSGGTYTGKWKIIPGIGMGGESGRIYQVFARITYMVNGKLVTTSTDAVEISVNPQPLLTVDYYLPHKIYPNASFRLGVSVTNSGSGTAKNVILDSSQLDIVSNTSGLKSVWEIVSSSFGSYNANSFRLVLGDIPGVNNKLADDGSDLPNTVWGYYTILWKIPELQENYLDDVYGIINDFTATITHKPYEGVELDSLISEVNTHIVARDSVKILDDTSGQYIDTMSVIVGTNGLPESIRNTDTNVSVGVFVPEGLSGNKSGEDSYVFTAPINTAALSDDNSALRYQILMLGESNDFAKENISAVYRYATADMSDEPVSLSFSNYWKDTYTVDGEEKDLLYVVDEILRDASGNILPRYYKVVYGSATTVTEIKTSKIAYLVDFGVLKRNAVFYDTGKFHDEDDTVPLGVQATVYNSGKNPESVMVYLFRAPVISGKTGSFTLVDKQSVTVNSYGMQLIYFYIDLYANAEMPAGAYEFRVGTSPNFENYAVSTTAVINALPTANAGVDFNATVNKTAVFDASRSYDPDGQIKSFIWEFGDGSSGWGIAPTHVYTSSGTYIATLTVTDDNGTANALITKDYDSEGLPSDSYAIHNVMVTVNDDRPDLIIIPEILTESVGKGLEITVGGEPVSKTNTVNAGDEIEIFARVMNDKPENAIPSTFTVSLYKDDVYYGYQRITTVYEKTYTIGDQTRTVQCADVKFTDIATDNESHVYTVRANDVSIAFEEADMFNNQRSQIVYGASGRTIFPNIGITAVTFEGKSLVNGATATKGMSIASGKSISFSVTLQNSGNDDTGEFPLTARINGKWAASENVSSIAPGQSVTITLSFIPEDGESQIITFTADGPYPRTFDTDRTDNTWTYNAGTITLAKS